MDYSQERDLKYDFTTSACRSATNCQRNAAFLLNLEFDATMATTFRLTNQVQRLKKVVLQREFISFFNLIQCKYYSNSVSFKVPMTALEGFNKYKKSTLLEGRHWAGDARLVLLLLSWHGQLALSITAGVPVILFEYYC